MQEACVRALRSFHRFEPGSRFRPWLLRILRNVVIDDYHRRRRSPETVDYDRVMEAMDGKGRENPVAPLVRSRRTRHEETMSLRLEEALGELPEESRTLLILAYVEGFRYEEIARIVDRPMGTVMSRLHRSRRRLLWRIGGIGRPATGVGLLPGR